MGGLLGVLHLPHPHIRGVFLQPASHASHWQRHRGHFASVTHRIVRSPLPCRAACQHILLLCTCLSVFLPVTGPRRAIAAAFGVRPRTRLQSDLPSDRACCSGTLYEIAQLPALVRAQRPACAMPFGVPPPRVQRPPHLCGVLRHPALVAATVTRPRPVCFTVNQVWNQRASCGTLAMCGPRMRNAAISSAAGVDACADRTGLLACAPCICRTDRSNASASFLWRPRLSGVRSGVAPCGRPQWLLACSLRTPAKRYRACTGG